MVAGALAPTGAPAFSDSPGSFATLTTELDLVTGKHLLSFPSTIFLDTFHPLTVAHLLWMEWFAQDNFAAQPLANLGESHAKLVLRFKKTSWNSPEKIMKRAVIS